MTLDLDSVIVAITALMVLLFVAGAEAMWRRRGGRATADAHRPTSGIDLVTAVIHHARRHPVGRQFSGAQGLEHAQRLPRSPEAGVERGIIKIVAVYRTYPVVVGETADGALLERSLPELADVPEPQHRDAHAAAGDAGGPADPSGHQRRLGVSDRLEVTGMDQRGAAGTEGPPTPPTSAVLPATASERHQHDAP